MRDAFGGRWGARASWGYWVNTAVWLPAIYILFAGIFAQLYAPGLSLAGQIAIGIGLTWLTVALNVVTLDVGKWVPNLGAAVKVLIFLTLIGAAIYHVATQGFANPINLETIRPTWSNSLAFIPAIIYGMLGFELVSASSEEIKDPGRNVPRGVLISGLMIIALYTLATTAMLAALPADEIDLVEGIVATLQQFGHFLYPGPPCASKVGLLRRIHTYFAVKVDVDVTSLQQSGQFLYRGPPCASKVSVLKRVHA